MENIQELLVKAQELIVLLPIYIDMVVDVVGSAALLATGIVRFTPKTSDDQKVGKVLSKIMDFLDWLPTIGVNPRTKKLKEAQSSLKR